MIEPYIAKLGKYFGYESKEDERKRQQDAWVNDWAERVARESNEYHRQKAAQQNEQNTSQAQQPTSYMPKSPFTSAQIEELNNLRNCVILEDLQMYPIIKINGQDMPNVVPGAGIFTAKINKDGEIVNLVVMLSTIRAIQEFERICNAYGTLAKDFWAEGYLVPPKGNLCYNILYVTKMRVCGKSIIF